MTLWIPLMRKISSAAVKLEMRRALNCRGKGRIKLLAILKYKRGLWGGIEMLVILKKKRELQGGMELLDALTEKKGWRVQTGICLRLVFSIEE